MSLIALICQMVPEWPTPTLDTLAVRKAACLFGCLAMMLVLLPPVQAADGSSPLDLSTLKRQARQGSETDQFILGRKMVGQPSSPEDLKAGLAWLKRSARQGYAPALLYLADLYEQGQVVDQDFIQAHHWYALGAEQGITAALEKLEPLRDIEPDQECVLFQIPVRRATRFVLRYALQKRGARFMETTDHGFCDLFHSAEVVQGTDQLQACYTEDLQIAQLTYRFPSPGKGRFPGFLDVFEQLEAKYGQAGRGADQDVQLYTWQCHEVRIRFWLQPGTRTAFLRYFIPDRASRLKQRLQAEAAAEAPAPENNL